MLSELREKVRQAVESIDHRSETWPQETADAALKVVAERLRERNKKLAEANREKMLQEARARRLAHELNNALGFIERECNYSVLLVDIVARIKTALAAEPEGEKK